MSALPSQEAMEEDFILHLPALRPMLYSDLEAVAAIEAANTPHPWTVGQLRDSLSAGHGAWVCQRAGLVVGFSVLMFVVDEAHVLNLGVAPALQRRGLGRMLLDGLAESARGQGAVSMWLEVRVSNARAIKLYASSGFAEVGRRRNYYLCANGREDALLMRRDL